jgi:hypothetical protein
VPFATSVTSWSAVMLVATTAVRRTTVPTPIAAGLLGGSVAIIDSVLADLGERRKADTTPTTPTSPVAAEPPDQPFRTDT